MDNVRHLYTVLAIMGFVSLPIIMNAEKVLPGDAFPMRTVAPFQVEDVFPLSRRAAPVAPAAAVETQPVSADSVAPAASLSIPQRWIDGPLGFDCKRVPVKPATTKGARKAAEPCLIV